MTCKYFSLVFLDGTHRIAVTQNRMLGIWGKKWNEEPKKGGRSEESRKESKELRKGKESEREKKKRWESYGGQRSEGAGKSKHRLRNPFTTLSVAVAPDMKADCAGENLKVMRV